MKFALLGLSVTLKEKKLFVFHKHYPIIILIKSYNNMIVLQEWTGAYFLVKNIIVEK